MKKLFFALALALCLCGCAKQQFALEETAQEEIVVEKKVIDLTEMNANMVYAEVMNMMNSPYEYRAKTVRVSGLLVAREEDGETKLACLILDAQECCQQGIEFLCENMTYPDDYPALGETITVEGVFSYYTDGASVNLLLQDALLF